MSARRRKPSEAVLAPASDPLPGAAAAPGTPGARGRSLLVYLIPALAAFLVYIGSLDGEFVWDDYNLIVENHWIKSLRNLRGVFTHDFFNRIGDDLSYGYYRPVITSTYTLDYAVWGLDARGYHLTNVLIHVACTLLVTAILLRLSLGLLATGIASLLFAVHPLHTENIAWISGRTDPVAFLFCALAFLLVLLKAPERPAPPLAPGGKKEKGTEPRPRRISWRNVALVAAACLMFAAALLAKEMSVVLIPWVGLVSLVRERRLPFRALLDTAPFVMVFGGYAVLRFVLLDVHMPGTIVEHTPRLILLSMGPTIARYLGWMLYRGELSAYVVNPYVESIADPRLALSWIVLGAAALLVYRLRGERLAVILAGMAATSFAPIVNFVRVSGPADMGNVMAERFAYFPSFPILALVGMAGAWLLQHRFAAVRGLAAAALILMIAQQSRATWVRNEEWHDEVTFFSKTMKQQPNMPLVMIRLAGAQIRSGDLEGAAGTLARAEYLAPGNPGALSVKASLYVARREYDKAIPIMEELLGNQVILGRIRAENNLAFLYAATGKQDRARRIWEQMVASNDGYAAVFYNLAEIYRREGDMARARELYEAAFDERPHDKRYAFGLAAVYRALGEPDRALAHYQKVLRLFPGDAAIQNNMAAIHEEMGAMDKALYVYEEAIAADPDYLLARVNYAAALEKVGRVPEAEVQLREVINRAGSDESDQKLRRMAEDRLSSLSHPSA